MSAKRRASGTSFAAAASGKPSPANATVRPDSIARRTTAALSMPWSRSKNGESTGENAINISRLDSAKGRARSSTPLTTVNTALLTPIPKARASTAMAVKPGLRRSAREAWRTSIQKVSKSHSHPAERTSSFTAARLPASTHAARKAASGDIPARTFSSTEAATNVRSSSSSSFSELCLCRSAPKPATMRLSRDITFLLTMLSERG